MADNPGKPIPVKKRISLKETFNNIMPALPEINEELKNQLLIGVIIGLVTLVIIWRLFRGGGRRRGVLIMGLCESGKTLLYSRLCHAKDMVTVTSLKEACGDYMAGKKSIPMYDLPGHERIRMALFDKVKKLVPRPAGIIFVMDSLIVQKDVRDVAEYLYTILSDGYVQKSRPKIMVACNKQDLQLARSSQLIQKTLEKEITLLRVTRANQLQSVGEGDNNNSYLGLHGKDFEFNHLGPIKVEFTEIITKGGEQLEPVTKWIQQIA